MVIGFRVTLVTGLRLTMVTGFRVIMVTVGHYFNLVLMNWEASYGMASFIHGCCNTKS